MSVEKEELGGGREQEESADVVARRGSGGRGRWEETRRRAVGDLHTAEVQDVHGPRCQIASATRLSYLDRVTCGV